MCLLTPTEHPGCSYVTQFICRVGWGQESPASSIRSPLFWVASKLLPGARWSPGSMLTLCLDYSLTLIDSSLPSEAEPELRTYISRRLSKGALLGGMGNIATVELRYRFHKLAAPDRVFSWILFAWCFKSDISIDTSRNVDYNKIDCAGNWDPEMQEWAGWLIQTVKYLLFPVSQSRRLAATAVLWSRKGLLISLMLTEMDTSSASWADLKRDWTYILCTVGWCVSASFKPPLFIQDALKLLFIYFLSIQNVKTRIFVLFFPHQCVFVQRNRFFLDPPYV